MAQSITVDKFIYNMASADTDWKRFMLGFGILMKVREIDITKEDGKALANLLLLGGDKVMDIYSLQEEKATLKYDAFLKIVEKEFTTCKKINLIRFRDLKQEEDESIDAYANRLKVAAVAAGVDAAHINEEALNVIIQNSYSREVKLKALEEDMDLAKLIKWGRGLEMRHECVNRMEGQFRVPERKQDINRIETGDRSRHSSSSSNHSGNSNPSSYQSAHSNNSQRRNHYNNGSIRARARQDHGRERERRPNLFAQMKASLPPNSCYSCGKEWPHQDICPAKGKFCAQCNGPDHFAKVCFQAFLSKQDGNRTERFNSIHAIEDQGGEDTLELIEQFEKFRAWKDKEEKEKKGEESSKINAILTKDGEPVIFLKVNGAQTLHLVDTGTGINILAKSAFMRLNPRPKLKETMVTASAFMSGMSIPFLGEFLTYVSFKGIEKLVRYVVLDGEATNILGYKTASDLGIITMDQDVKHLSMSTFKVNKIVHELENPLTTHPELFDGHIGCLKDFQLHLEVDKSIRPHQSAAFRVPIGMQALVKAKLERLEQQGIIKRPNSRPTWVSAMHPVEKVDDKGQVVDVRITICSKILNKALLPVKRHTPAVVDITQKLNGCKWFTGLDFNEAFSQIAYDEETEKLNGMATIFGLWIQTRMHMGLSCASEIFQELVENLLGDIKGVQCALDDVIIGCETKEQCIKSTRECLDRIKAAGMTLNYAKCAFVKEEIVFFGMIVSADGIRPKLSKWKKLMDMTPPTNSKEVQSFIGLVNYFKNRSPNQSQVDTPLRKLMGLGKNFPISGLGIQEMDAFNKLKEIVLRYLDHFYPDRTTYIWNDAGPEGCSNVLTQWDQKTGKRSVVRCGSHAFSEAELNYSHLEKEALGCVLGLEDNHWYIYNAPAIAISDAKAVIKLLTTADPKAKENQRIRRWRSRISNYPNVKWEHRAGHDNIADYLSRRFKKDTMMGQMGDTGTIKARVMAIEVEMNKDIMENTRLACLPEINIERIMTETAKDQEISAVLEAIKTKAGHKDAPKWVKPYRKVWNELSNVGNNILLRNNLICIPVTLRDELVKRAHMGHTGPDTIKRLLRSISWYPGMNQHIEDTINDCGPCVVNSDTTTTEPMQPTALPGKAWENIAMDFSSRTPTNDYVLAAKDEYSREKEIGITRRLTSEAAIVLAKNFFMKHGTPKVVKTDNGPAFKSKEWADFARKAGFRHRKITPLNPQANGSAEAIMKPLNHAIRTALVENSSWKCNYNNFLRMYRQTPHSATGYSPNLIMRNDDTSSLLPLFKTTQNMEEIRTRLVANDTKAKLRMKLNGDRYLRAKHRVFKLQDPVVVRWDRTNKYMSIFDPKPYRITRMVGTMIVAKRPDHTITRNAKFFRQISEKCYAHLESLKRVEPTPKRVTFVLELTKKRPAIEDIEQPAHINMEPPQELEEQREPRVQGLPLREEGLRPRKRINYTQYNYRNPAGASAKKTRQSELADVEEVPEEEQS